MRFPDQAWPGPHRRSCLHASVCSCTQRPGDTGILVLSQVHARGHRSHARRLHCGRRRDGHQGCRHFGDILCARMAKRNVAALVTDGVVRDLDGVLGTNLPVWCSGAAAPSVAGLTFVDWDQPVGCGGVAVFSNDVIIIDNDGAVVIPEAMIDEFSKPPRSRSAWRAGSCKKSTMAQRCPACTLPTPKTRRATKSGRRTTPDKRS